ncbi:glycosyltransferase [Oryzicola mucosus]|uniref:Glycosyltransferase n=1 Tax=Oryzicola mucosus TaxID=2767425 RepID=A0A8J6PWD2_9HYPH|nr:glycosyltransferase [Oryzicola mucosus]MBD0415996.1 glycosyltransferase [Oryzicola mucosus]
MKNVDRERGVIEASGLFDRNWYLAQYPDVAALGMDPLEHFLTFGALLRRNPNPGFNTRQYLETNPDIARTGINPLFHFLSLGEKAGQKPVAVNGSAPAEKPIIVAFQEPKKDIASQHKSHVANGVAEGAIAASFSKLSNLDDHKLIVRAGLFDPEWYRSEYPDVARGGGDPVRHFLRHGAREGRDPGPAFNTKWYLSRYRDEMIHDNPLINYLRHGYQNGHDPYPSVDFDVWWRAFRQPLRDRALSGSRLQADGYANLSGVNERLRQATEMPAIIVPVYNAAEETDACIQSILRNTRLNYRLIVVDDCSPDASVQTTLAKYRGIDQVEIHRNEKNLGFSGTINRGIELAGRSDVVFLNSDTLVTPNWLDKLRFAAYSTEKTGTVTAVSNNAGAFSVPQSGTNEMPAHLSLDDYARAIAQTSLRLYPTAPTGNGFCLYVRRDCIDEVGTLDAAAFPRGYGEENDFCMRAGRKGWRHIIDDATFIYHVRSASFGSEKDGLMQQGRSVVDARYPEYTSQVREFVRAEPLKLVRERVSETLKALESRQAAVKPRIMYVLSTKTGGTPQTNQDLMGAIDGRYETFVLRCNSSTIKLFLFQNGVYTEIERAMLGASIHAFPHTSREYDDIVSLWMTRYAIDLVHIRHIAWHGLGLVKEAKTLNIPVIFSFHDFYSVCPSVKLLENDNRYNAGKCSPSHAECKKELWDVRDFLALPEDGIDHWKAMFGEMLSQCDGFITTDSSAREIVLENYPNLADKPFEIIPHGRDFDKFSLLAAPLEPGEKLRILLPGNIDAPKGSEIVFALSAFARQHGFEFHIIGSAQGSLVQAGPGGETLEGVVLHGPYERDAFGMLVARIKPHIGAVLSIWPETFCHTLTELWSCGLPVIGFDIGAVGQRIKDSQAGWAIPEMTADAVLKTLDAIRSTPTMLIEAIGAVDRWQKGLGASRDCAAMAEDYAAAYADIEARNHAHIPGVAGASAGNISLDGRNVDIVQYDVDVVIPVYNALDFTKDCLASIQRHNDGLRVRSFVVNDGSDAETTQWLREFCADKPDFVLKEHEVNKGYTNAVNTGLMASTAEYVITLNSDTVVTNGWLAGMIRCMLSDERIGICGPLSNAATWQNVPHLYADDGSFAINDIPDGLNADEMAALVAQASARIYPRTPFVNGFCYMIRRSVVDAVGFMDPISFPIGYGEENDYCIRAADAGFQLAYADDAYVFHAKSKSFGHGKRKKLGRDGAAALRAKHGVERVEALIESVKVTDLMDSIRKRVVDALAVRKQQRQRLRNANDLSVLFLLPVRGGGGGVHSVVQEVMGMRRIGANAAVAVRNEDIEYYWSQYNDIADVRQLFLGFDGDDLADIAASYDVVVSTIFTSVVLLKKISDKNPEVLPAYYIQDYEPLFWKPTKPQWIQAKESYELVPQALCFAKTRWLTEKVFAEHNVEVRKVEPSIDHEVYKPSTEPRGDELIVSAMIRPRTPRRGAARTMRVLSRLHQRFGEKIKIHIFGCEEFDPIFEELERGFPYINHDIIKRQQVAEILGTSDVFLDLSDYQAFGRTGLEGMACGCVPVLPVVGGADEYAVDGYNSIVVDTKDEDAVFDRVCKLLDDPDALIECKQAAIRTAARYSVHLASVSELTVFHEALRLRAKSVRKGVRPKALIIPSGQKDGSPTGSAYVRLIHPYMQAGVRKQWDVSVGDSQTLPHETEASTIIVERDLPTLTADEISAWADRMRSQAKRIVYEIDDDLLNAEGLKSRGYNKDIGKLKERVTSLAKSADLITVSTQPLKERFDLLNKNVRVIPNYLNYQMWKLGEDTSPTKPKTSDVIKIGYIGTPSHSVDMHVVSDAISKIQAKYGKRVEVEVVGAFQTQTPFFGKRIGLPRNNNYAPFVDWLFKVVDWDIGITPLVDDDFNRCKSNLKFLEYAALRLPNIVSNVYTYRDVARNGVNSLVVNNSTAEWTAALTELIENSELREKLRQNAFEMVREKYSVRHHVDTYIDVLERAG